ncbi:hypothetical protein [Rhizobium sp. LjRoot254]|uniref:hypothetical protein n=1 Tax=Rhizobium sp. LjRoot254 TaxID=3342297 RepID=UPI003ECFF168
MANDVVAERVDEQIYSETMLERIYRQIDAADFIIADLTGRNPNVFYEIGYAHAKQKQCILLTQHADDIPFDLKHHRHLVYEGKIQKLRDLIDTEIKWQKEQLEKRRSHTFSITLKSADALLSKSTWAASAEVDFKIDLHNHTDRRSPEIEAVYIHTATGWTLTQNKENCPQATSSLEDAMLRHFVKSPVVRLSPGGWAQIVVKGVRTVWNKYSSTEELQESYALKGFLPVEIVTSEGSFVEKLNIAIVAEEFPF